MFLVLAGVDKSRKEYGLGSFHRRKTEIITFFLLN